MDGRPHHTRKIMESPSPFDLNDAIRRWHRSLSESPAFRADDLEELESHARGSVATLVASGLSEEEAFFVATRRMGNAESLREEFAKVNSGHLWLHRALWMLGGILLSQLIIPLAHLAGFFAFVVARNFLPIEYTHLPTLAGALVILGVGSALVFAVCRLAVRGQTRITEWSHHWRKRPLLVVMGIALLVEGLHALDTAASHTTTLGLRPPSIERSLPNVISFTQRFIQNVEAGHRPFGSGAVLYSILQFAPELLLLGAFVLLAFRRAQPGGAIMAKAD